ncbi:MAG: hypothetical protein ACK41C_12755 [Phenylobacterium sp.]|uniref:hypothetical protein n=1 Tax=Phenylobacterium sp. TaxID=1871053 RepID=UPI00391A2E01
MQKPGASPRIPTVRDVLLAPVDLGMVLKWQRPQPAPYTPPPGGGARVQVRSYDVVENNLGVRLPPALERLLPDHAYVEYDDGRERFIARGGPSAQGKAFVDNARNGTLRVQGGVEPAAQSVDNNKGTKVLDTTFLPGRTANEAAQPARDYTRRVNQGQNLYGATTNSNSFAFGAAESSTGRRSRHPEAWGHDTRLGDGRLAPDIQRSREILGPGLGSTKLGRVLSKMAEDVDGRLPIFLNMRGY